MRAALSVASLPRLGALRRRRPCEPAGCVDVVLFFYSERVTLYTHKLCHRHKLSLGDLFSVLCTGLPSRFVRHFCIMSQSVTSTVFSQSIFSVCLGLGVDASFFRFFLLSLACVSSVDVLFCSRPKGKRANSMCIAHAYGSMAKLHPCHLSRQMAITAFIYIVYTNAQTHTATQTQAQAHAHAQTHAHRHARTRRRTRTQTHRHTYTDTAIHTHTHTHTRARAHTRAHTHTYTYPKTHAGTHAYLIIDIYMFCT